MKYPNVIDGAIAGSAPILAFDNVSKESAKKAGKLSYWKIVTDDATAAFGSAENCAPNVRRAWKVLDFLYAHIKDGPQLIAEALSLCSPPSSIDELERLKVYLQIAFDTMAMGNFPFPSSYLASGLAVLPSYPFRKACDYLKHNFTNDEDINLLHALGLGAAVFNNATKTARCFDLPADPDYDGIWDYLWCTDTLCQETYFGRNGIDDMFWEYKYDEEEINRHCNAKYHVEPSYGHIKKEYGGILGVRNASNIVFSNGRFDPWRSGGVTSINDTVRSLWSIIIPNGAHHVDLMFTTTIDPPDLGVARRFEIERIKEWVGLTNVNKKQVQIQTQQPDDDPVYPAIDVVHVISSCHLDLGFIELSVDIVNLYFDHHLPMAADVGTELRQDPSGFTDNKLNFMFQSWVISMYFDCPIGMDFHCPNATAQAKVRNAIEVGDITWHAFPHNAQLEVMSQTMIYAGLQLTKDVDAMFKNQSTKTTLSQRDVPGMPRAIVSLLNRSGVSGISIGANDGSTPPDLEKVFIWEDEKTQTSLYVLFNWPGYGSLGQQVVLPNLTHALVYNWNGDNAGPRNSSDYRQNWKAIQSMFPNAQIVASTLDNFTSQLDSVRDQLPVITADIGDTWVYGVPSDPQKVARMAAMERVWSKHDLLNLDDHILRNASRFALKLGEHTDGRDVKSYLKDNTNWKNVDFDRARATGGVNASQYAALETSWWEQRQWGISTAVDTLKSLQHPMYADIMKEFEALGVSVPDVSTGFSVGKANVAYSCGQSSLTFGDDGSISSMSDKSNSSMSGEKMWADEAHLLAAIRYRTYSSSDVKHFQNSYCKSNASWVNHDYGKPNMPKDTLGKIWTPRMDQLYVEKPTTTSCTFILHATFEEVATNEYGAMSDIWTNVTVLVESNGGLKKVYVAMNMMNKTTTRLPESLFVQFHPLLGHGGGGTGGSGEVLSSWEVNELGSWSSPNDIVNGGSKRQFGSNMVRVKDENGSQMSITSVDTVVSSFGKLQGYPIPTNETADTSHFGMSFLLSNNLWGTNYLQWFPITGAPPAAYSSAADYFPTEFNADLLSRFELSIEHVPHDEHGPKKVPVDKDE